MGWINTNYEFGYHAANFRLDDRFLRTWFGTGVSALESNPEAMAAFLESLLVEANHGAYVGGQILRIFQPCATLEWVITILHPSLPRLEPGQQLPDLPLTIDAERVHHMLARLGIQTAE